MSSKLHELSATECVRAVARGDIRSLDIVNALLHRIEATDSKLLAWVTIDSEGAIRQAQQADELRALSGPLGPLDGVVVGIKDNIDTRAMRTAAGFPPFRERVPSKDAVVVASLRRAGAIVLGKVATTQFAVSDPAPTLSPWDAARTPGGSSTGSAVAVAARHVSVAVGTQTAGSVLKPASFCGVVGYKPTIGLVSTAGVMPVAWSLDHVGVIARTVEDCELFLTVAGRQDSPVVASLLHGAQEVPKSASSPPTIGVVSEAFDLADPAVAEATQHSLHLLQEAGAVLRRVQLTDTFRTFHAVHRVIIQSELAAVHEKRYGAQREDYEPILRRMIEVGCLVPAWAYVQAQQLRQRLQNCFARSFDGGIDVLALPAVPTPPPDRSQTGSSKLLSPFTLVGAPTVSLPCGVADAMPQGLQLVGAIGRDDVLLDSAKWCSSALKTFPFPEIGGT